MRRFLSFIFVFVFAFSANAAFAKNKEPLPVKPSGQELSVYQVKAFEGVDTLVVMKSVLNVLQDENYFVEQTDSKIGYILAAQEFDTYDPYIDIKETFGCKKLMTGIKRYSVARTEGTFVVAEDGKAVTVRVKARKKILNMYDVEIKITDIIDAAFYDSFFAKLQTELNVYKNEKASVSEPVRTEEKQETTSAKAPANATSAHTAIKKKHK